MFQKYCEIYGKKIREGAKLDQRSMNKDSAEACEVVAFATEQQLQELLDCATHLRFNPDYLMFFNIFHRKLKEAPIKKKIMEENESKKKIQDFNNLLRYREEARDSETEHTTSGGPGGVLLMPEYQGLVRENDHPDYSHLSNTPCGLVNTSHPGAMIYVAFPYPIQDRQTKQYNTVWLIPEDFFQAEKFPPLPPFVIEDDKETVCKMGGLTRELLHLLTEERQNEIFSKASWRIDELVYRQGWDKFSDHDGTTFWTHGVTKEKVFQQPEPFKAGQRVVQINESGDTLAEATLMRWSLDEQVPLFSKWFVLLDGRYFGWTEISSKFLVKPASMPWYQQGWTKQGGVYKHSIDKSMVVKNLADIRIFQAGDRVVFNDPKKVWKDQEELHGMEGVILAEKEDPQDFSYWYVLFDQHWAGASGVPARKYKPLAVNLKLLPYDSSQVWLSSFDVNHHEQFRKQRGGSCFVEAAVEVVLQGLLSSKDLNIDEYHNLRNNFVADYLHKAGDDGGYVNQVITDLVDRVKQQLKKMGVTSPAPSSARRHRGSILARSDLGFFDVVQLRAAPYYRHETEKLDISEKQFKEFQRTLPTGNPGQSFAVNASMALGICHDEKGGHVMMVAKIICKPSGAWIITFKDSNKTHKTYETYWDGVRRHYYLKAHGEVQLDRPSDWSDDWFITSLVMLRFQAVPKYDKIKDALHIISNDFKEKRDDRTATIKKGSLVQISNAVRNYLYPEYTNVGIVIDETQPDDSGPTKGLRRFKVLWGTRVSDGYLEAYEGFSRSEGAIEVNMMQHELDPLHPKILKALRKNSHIKLQIELWQNLPVNPKTFNYNLYLKFDDESRLEHGSIDEIYKYAHATHVFNATGQNSKFNTTKAAQRPANVLFKRMTLINDMFPVEGMSWAEFLPDSQKFRNVLEVYVNPNEEYAGPIGKLVKRRLQDPFFRSLPAGLSDTKEINKQKMSFYPNNYFLSPNIIRKFC